MPLCLYPQKIGNCHLQRGHVRRQSRHHGGRLRNGLSSQPAQPALSFGAFEGAHSAVYSSADRFRVQWGPPVRNFFHQKSLPAFEWSSARLIDWLIDLIIKWLIDWSNNQVLDWLIDWLTECFLWFQADKSIVGQAFRGSPFPTIGKFLPLPPIRQLKVLPNLTLILHPRALGPTRSQLLRTPSGPHDCH